MSYQIPGGVAIGGAVAGGTPGSVLFAGAGSVLAQDNANLFWDDTNNRLGIGYATPTFPLSLGQSGGDKIALYDGGANSYGFGIGVNLLQIFSSGAGTGAVAIGTGPSSAFVETMRVTPTGVEIDGAKTLAFDAVVGDKITFAGTQTGFGLQPNTLQMFVSQPSVDKIALGFGSSGTFTEAFSIVSSSATPATGLRLTAAAAAGGVTLMVTSSGATENLNLAAKGATARIQFNSRLYGDFSGTGITGNLLDFTPALGAAGRRFALDASTGDLSVRSALWPSFNGGLQANKMGLNSSNDANGTANCAVWCFRPGLAAITSSFSTSTLGGTLAFPPDSPAQITADQNDYSAGTGRSMIYRLSSDASRNITGLQPAADTNQPGEFHYLINVGANNIVLVNESASSTAANRFTTNTGADITLAANEIAIAIYDGTSTRWRVAKL